MKNGIIPFKLIKHVHVITLLVQSNFRNQRNVNYFGRTTTLLESLTHKDADNIEPLQCLKN